MSKYVPDWYLRPEDTLSQDILSEVLTFKNFDPFFTPFTTSAGLGAVKHHIKNIKSGLQDIVTFMENGGFQTQFYDREVIEGKERTITYGTDSVTYQDVIIEPILFELEDLNRLASPIDFRSHVTVQLEQVYEDNYEWHMAGLATFLNAGKIKGNYWNHNVVGVKPTYDRISLPVNAVAYPTRAEYNDGGGAFRQISGANGILRNAIIVDPVTGVLTLDQAIKAKDTAKLGGRGTPLTENVIRAISTVNAEGRKLIANEYVFVMDTACRRQFEKQEQFQKLALKPLENRNAPDLLRGSLYMGTIDGIHFYEYPALSMHRITDNGQTFAFNMLMGQDAYYLGETPKGVEMLHQDYNYKRQQGFSLCDTRGYKALQKPSRTGSAQKVEAGIIFCPANITASI